jgi:putative endonuclease
MSQWFLYIILTEKNRLYTGITTDLERRFYEHLMGKKGAKFFRSDSPITIIYTEKFANRSLASIRESQIKKMNRLQKEQLVNN